MTLANINPKEVKEAKNVLSFDDERSYAYVYKEHDFRELIHGHVAL
jgi:hypothetical protein